MCRGPHCPPGAGPSPVAREAQDPEAGTPGRCRGASRDGAHHTRPHRPLLPTTAGSRGLSGWVVPCLPSWKVRESLGVQPRLSEEILGLWSCVQRTHRTERRGDPAQRLARGPAHRPTRPRPSHLAVAPPTPVAPPTLLWLCPHPRPAHLAVAPPTPTPRPPCCGRAGKRGF